MKAEVTDERRAIVFPDDDVVVPKFNGGIVGGRVLDVSEVTGADVRAGHVIITDGKGAYKPLAVSGDGYSAVPGDWAICGVLYRTVLTRKPWASIMTDGRLNIAAAPYKITAVEADFKAALPLVELVKDEEA